MLPNFQAIVPAIDRICYSLAILVINRGLNMNYSIWKFITTGLLLVLLTGISACGQKGDLYLPPKDVSQQQSLENSHV